MYEHERRERKNNGEIKHVVMPTVDNRWRPEMYDYLEGRGLSFDLAQANGWYPTFSKGPRIVIPCVNSYNFNYWQARSMDPDHPLRYDSPAIPRKDSIVFLWPCNPDGYKEDMSTVVITEGPMDALAAAEKYPAIAVMGARPSEEVVSFIKKKTLGLGLTRLILCPDKDGVFEFLQCFPIDDRGWKAIMPTTKDLASMPRWERNKLLGGI